MARLDVINPMDEQQETKGLILITTESEEIMWVHSNIIKDEQWETNRPKLKGKSCNAISIAADDDSVTVTSLSDSEGEKPALASQASTSQPVATRSSKQFLWQYDQTRDGAPQPMISGAAAPVQAPVPRDKEKQKEIRFDESLKKNPSRGLNAPSALTY